MNIKEAMSSSSFLLMITYDIFIMFNLGKIPIWIWFINCYKTYTKEFDYSRKQWLYQFLQRKDLNFDNYIKIR